MVPYYNIFEVAVMYIKMPLKFFERFRKQIAKHGNKIISKRATDDEREVILIAS